MEAIIQDQQDFMDEMTRPAILYVIDNDPGGIAVCGECQINSDKVDGIVVTFDDDDIPISVAYDGDEAQPLVPIFDDEVFCEICGKNSLGIERVS